MQRHYLEVELKYNAKDITLTEFKDFCSKSSPTRYTQASGWDYFYSSKEDLNQFGRYRVGPDFAQLTVKTKTTDKNNFIREEDNLDFKESISEDRVRSFFNKFKYSYQKSIFKNCFIYKYPLYTMVYYCIYNQDMNEIGRFMEIEMSEEHPWESENEAWEAMVVLERDCKVLGITPQARIKKSLFEIVCG